MVNRAGLDEAIARLGLGGKPVAFHASLRSFGLLDGGAGTFLQAFSDQGCTLLAPVFTYACEGLPQVSYPQNGLDPGDLPDPSETEAYDPAGNQVSVSMGAIQARMLTWPGRQRGFHPLNSLVAVGPLASRLVLGQQPLDVYAPYRELYALPGAALLLVGVDLTSATPIHYAENLAGRRLFRRWGLLENGLVECETGSCSDGFNQLFRKVEPVEQRLYVGKSLWRVFPFAPFIDRVTAAIRANPEITRCGPACPRCRDAILGGPGIPD